MIDPVRAGQGPGRRAGPTVIYFQLGDGLALLTCGPAGENSSRALMGSSWGQAL